MIRKHADVLIEQKKTKLQETLEFKLNKQIETFSLSPPINLSSEKWSVAVTYFEATVFLSNITNENNSFSISTPGHWNCNDGEELIKKLHKLLQLRSQKDIELHVEEVGKKGNQLKMRDKEYILFDLWYL